MNKLKWYMAEVADEEIDHEWEQFESDEEAIAGFNAWAYRNGTVVLEIWECEDDECLTPKRLVWH